MSGKNRKTAASKPRGRAKSGVANGSEARTGSKPRAASGRRRWLPGVMKWGATLAVWGVIVTVATVAWLATDLPDLDDALKTTRQPTVTILAADGSELYRGGDLYGQTVALKDIPPALPAAVLATEDRRFYDHFGLDPIGLARAVYRNLRAGRIVQGGSTITQQLAKNLFLTPARTYKRKSQEVMLAIWLEHMFSKDQILTLYLNRVYLGAGTYGVDAAAMRYFGKPVTRLSTYEAAVIAGLLKAPSRYNPIADPKRAQDRAKVVLANMVAAGYLTDAQAVAAAQQNPVAVASSNPGQARHFVDWVLAALPDYVSRTDQDVIIKTTLMPAMQQAASKAITWAMARGKAANVGDGALVAMSPSGAVRALVGGRDYRKSQFNRAVQAQRQPGSAFKPLVYLTALEAGMTAETPFDDRPVAIGAWRPGNFSGKYEGRVTLGDALAKSINTVAVQAVQKVSPRRVIKTARRLGIISKLPADAGIALGTGEVSLMELTAAYGVLARGGLSVWPYAIETITDPAGTVLYHRQGSGPDRVAKAVHVQQLTAMMARVVTTGTGKNAGFGRPAAGKTGTSQDHRDAWFVGYTPQLVAGIWLGNDDATPMKRITGGGLPALAWRDFMLAAHTGMPLLAFDGGPDDGIVPAKRSFWQRLALCD